MKLSADLQRFEARLGHRFLRPELLIRALTHPSIATPARPDNQRLEFLGDRVLGDAIEAVIAAVYRDAGFDAARDVVLRIWGDRVGRVEADARDAKTALQEWAQARGLPPPSYIETAREGPPHQPVFTIAARLTTGEEHTATAGSKRLAEQAAARALLARLESTP